MTGVRVIGVDPGPTPGIVVLDVVKGQPSWIEAAEVIQCTAGLALELLHALCSWSAEAGADTYVQVERFVTRGNTNAAQRLTADMARDVHDLEDVAGVRVVERPAVGVKPWATDQRLERAGLVEATKGMRHARDAARHALFCAVHDAGVPDPLSKEYRR